MVGARSWKRRASPAYRGSTTCSFTHFHGDHVGGVPELAQLIPIGAFIDHDGVTDDAERVAGTLAMHKAYTVVRACWTAPRAGSSGQSTAADRRRRAPS